jgi:hypothetical protein
MEKMRTRKKRSLTRSSPHNMCSHQMKEVVEEVVEEVGMKTQIQ